MNGSKIGVIDVGGGLRGIYAAGVFDFLIENGIDFDYGIGISAGSANLTSYIGKQVRRNFAFYHDYSQRKEYMGVGELLKNHSYLNLDYLYSTLSNSDGENPLNYQGIAASEMDWRIVATNAETGCPKYFTKNDIAQDDYCCAGILFLDEFRHFLVSSWLALDVLGFGENQPYFIAPVFKRPRHGDGIAECSVEIGRSVNKDGLAPPGESRGGLQ